MCISDLGVMELNGMEFHAFHGCLERERREGNLFVVDFKGFYHLGAAARSDRLEDAADYSVIYQLVAREMEQPSALLEHLASRIARAIRASFPEAFSKIEVRVSKLNPPVGGPCAWSRITVTI